MFFVPNKVDRTFPHLISVKPTNMDPAKMKVVDLRSELGALGLDTKGNKPALVERLKKALESKSGKGKLIPIIVYPF